MTDLRQRVRDSMAAHVARRSSFTIEDVASALRAEPSAVLALVHELAPEVLAPAKYFFRTRADGAPLYNPYGGEAILAQAPDARLPAQMPTTWTLVAKDGGGWELECGTERMPFSAWLDARYEAPGRVLTVSWKRSALGTFNIVERVEPVLTPADHAARQAELDAIPRMRVSEWLEGWKAATGHAITQRKLLALATDAGDDVLSEALAADELFHSDLERLPLLFDETAGVMRFVWADDATDSCVDELKSMLGLRSDPDVPRGASFETFVAAYSASAPGPKRAWVIEVPTGHDAHLLVTTPNAFRALTTRRADGLQLLYAHAPAPEPP